MSHAAGHFFIFFTYFPTYIYGEEQHFATLSANTSHAALAKYRTEPSEIIRNGNPNLAS